MVFVWLTATAAAGVALWWITRPQYGPPTETDWRCTECPDEIEVD